MEPPKVVLATFGIDQPDNAARVVRLGVGRTLELRRYRVATIVRELQALDDDLYRTRAIEIGKQIAGEDGAGAAADIIVGLLEQRRAPAS
jgi:UDP:flavonoid glycosyltransferase YjiC (YdhE family)